MYKTEKIVKEDMIISKSCPGGKKIFTGGESILQLPFTISFMDKGKYKVRISNSQVVVEKID